MRKLAPAFVLTTLIAVASAPAFAMGDKRKAENANGAATGPPASTYSVPSTPASKPATNGSGVAATQSDAKTAAIGANDPTRCDPAKYASRDLMPKGCGAGSSGDGATASGSGTGGSAASSSASSSGPGSSGGDSK